MTSKMSQEAKKDEFKKYLEKAGVLELLTKSLVQLYEEPDKPSDALNYLKNTVGGTTEDQQVIGNLRTENAELRAKLKEMEANQSSLEAKIAALEAAGGDTEDVPMAENVETAATPIVEAQIPDSKKDTDEKVDSMETEDSAMETSVEPSATTDTPAEPQVEAAAETPAEAPETPSDAPVEAPAKSPDNAPTETPVEAPAETSAETPVEAGGTTETPAPVTGPETVQPQVEEVEKTDAAKSDE